MLGQVHAQLVGTIDIEVMKGKSFTDVFDLLMDQGFTNIAPVPVESNLPEETVIGIKIRGQNVSSTGRFPVNSPVRVLVSMGSKELFQGEETDESETEIATGNLLEITTDPIYMTGKRFQPIEIVTDPIFITGMRFQSIEITTDRIFMTGLRFEPIEINTEPIFMTGCRFIPITINTDRIFMTGRREAPEEEPVQPLEKKKKDLKQPVVQPKIQKQPKKTVTPETPDISDPVEPVEPESPIEQNTEPVDSTKMKLLNNLKPAIDPQTNTPVLTPEGPIKQ
jgi:hypothetical protein